MAEDNNKATEELTDAVQNLSLKEGSAAEDKKTDEKKPRKKTQKKKEKTDTDAAATPAEEGDQEETGPEFDNTAKVFVGNLSFNTTKEQLEEFFGKAGKIANINIITRGQRSLGYGFISFESDEEADKAVELLDKTELDGRQINVERAQDKEPGEFRPRGRGGFRGRGRFRRGFSRGPRGRGFFRGGFRGRGRGRGGYAGRSEEARVDEEETPATEEAVGEEPGEHTEGGSGRGRGRGRGSRRFRTPREPRETSDETSKTTIFVANLPFKVTDEDLASIFKDYNVASAHVVKLRSGRSKGFGFVEVANEEEQQKVLSELKNVVVDDRELVIKVAMAYQTPPAREEGEAASSEAAAQ